MTRAPRALIAVDAGAATTSVALVGRPAGRWRLLGSIAAPAGTPEDALASLVIERVIASAPDLAAEIGVTAGSAQELPRLEARSAPVGTLAVLTASRRAGGIFGSMAARTAWRVRAASPETHDPREMTELALDPAVGALLVGAGDPPGPDERGALDDLAALVAAVAVRRPELRIVLSGSIRSRRAWNDAIGDGLPGDPERVVLAPAPRSRDGRDDAARAILEGLLPADDARLATAESIRSLAEHLDRRVELIEVGFDGGLRARAAPGVADAGPTLEAVRSARGALVPSDLDDGAVEAVLGWTTGSLDRHRMGDRLRELRTHPWSDATGDGARLRLAAARAALARLIAATADMSASRTPDVTILAGGAFAVVPPRAIMLAVADLVRRPGATQLLGDHARLLGPIGTIEDPDERRGLLADLADDLLVPLGTLVVIGGSRAGRGSRGPIGTVEISGDGPPQLRDLEAGEFAFLDLGPGRAGTARLEFRRAVRIGRRARRVSVPVSGGSAGVAVDVREIPLELPERRDRRRAVLAGWDALTWPGDER